MRFPRFYIKNYHANYNSNFPMKVKGLTGKNNLYTRILHRDCLCSLRFS